MPDQQDEPNDPPSLNELEWRDIEVLLVRARPKPDPERLAEVRRRLFGSRPSEVSELIKASK